MRVLAFDPGAARSGYASVIGGGPEAQYEASGLVSFPRPDGLDFQHYRMWLIDGWVLKAQELIDTYKPDVIVTEIIPAVGGGNFVVATQSYLAHAQVTTVHAIAMLNHIHVVGVGATTVKAKIGGKKNATKVQVRNGVIAQIPSLAPKKKEWTKVFDESDACAIALTYLGYYTS